MATRSFRSPDGVAWQAWDVSPAHSPTTNTMLHLPYEMREGWLCFQAGDDKRRLVPAPASWETSTPEELWAMCGDATPVHRASNGDTRALAAGMSESV